MKIEKSFVIEKSDVDKVCASLLAHYGERVHFTTQKGIYDFNISFSEEAVFINLVENSYWETDFPESFIQQANETFSIPLYFFLDTNNVGRAEEFWGLLSTIKKIFFEEGNG